MTLKRWSGIGVPPGWSRDLRGFAFVPVAFWRFPVRAGGAAPHLAVAPAHGRGRDLIPYSGNSARDGMVIGSQPAHPVHSWPDVRCQGRTDTGRVQPSGSMFQGKHGSLTPGGWTVSALLDDRSEE